MRFCQILELFSDGGCARQPLRTEPCQCVCGQPWAYHGPLQGQMQPLQCSAGLVEPALGAAAGLCRWFGRVAALPDSGVFQRWRLCSATTAHRALLVCVWPALGISWGTARSNAASAVPRRCGGSCTGCCGRAVQVVCKGRGFGRFWSFSVMEAIPGNHCAQSPASVCVASPGHAAGH